MCTLLSIILRQLVSVVQLVDGWHILHTLVTNYSDRFISKHYLFLWNSSTYHWLFKKYELLSSTKIPSSNLDSTRLTSNYLTATQNRNSFTNKTIKLYWYNPSDRATFQQLFIISDNGHHTAAWKNVWCVCEVSTLRWGHSLSINPLTRFNYISLKV